MRHHFISIQRLIPYHLDRVVLPVYLKGKPSTLLFLGTFAVVVGLVPQKVVEMPPPQQEWTPPARVGLTRDLHILHLDGFAYDGLTIAFPKKVLSLQAPKCLLVQVGGRGQDLPDLFRLGYQFAQFQKGQGRIGMLFQRRWPHVLGQGTMIKEAVHNQPGIFHEKRQKVARRVVDLVGREANGLVGQGQVNTIERFVMIKAVIIV